MRALAAAGIVVAILACAPAGAAVTETAGSCAVSSPGFSFTYEPMARASAESISTINVACTNVTGPLALTIDLSAGNSNGYGTRVLAGPRSSRLSYNVFSNGRSSVFGDGSGATVHYQRVLSPNGPAAADSFAIQLLVPPGQDVVPGAYGDALQLSVNF